MKIAQTKTVALGSEDYGWWQEIFRRQNEHDLITDWMWRVRRAVRNHSGFLLSSQAGGGTTHPIRNTEDQWWGKWFIWEYAGFQVLLGYSREKDIGCRELGSGEVWLEMQIWKSCMSVDSFEAMG